jgi:hypothetical protein
VNIAKALKVIFHAHFSKQLTLMRPSSSIAADCLRNNKRDFHSNIDPLRLLVALREHH